MGFGCLEKVLGRRDVKGQDWAPQAAPGFLPLPGQDPPVAGGKPPAWQDELSSCCVLTVLVGFSEMNLSFRSL